MKSTAKTVDDYIFEAPENRITALTKLRNLCLDHLPDHKENMVYNMPGYVRKDQVEVAFASQKQYISIYIMMHEVMLNNENRLRGLNHGKGCIRYSNPDKIDYDLIAFLLDETNECDSTIC